MTGLNREQVEALLRPIKPARVLELRGQSHVPAYDVAAHLTRVLGFGNWDKEILNLTMLFEEPTTTGQGKPAWTVAYSCTLRLTIKDEHGVVVARYEDGATGDSLQPSRADAHDMALKSAISYALKRCAAFGLGDQFGLSLYNKGDKKALVRQTLIWPMALLGQVSVDLAVDLEDGISVPQTLGNDERDDAPPDPAVPEVAVRPAAPPVVEKKTTTKTAPTVARLRPSRPLPKPRKLLTSSLLWTTPRR